MHSASPCGPCSAIDRILVPYELFPFIINGTVDNDCSLSLSDQDYTFAVSHILWPINIPNPDASEIEM